jgi:hypothetical protein
MILLAIFGTVGFGIYLDGYVIHPPAQYTGICAPPAAITRGGCYITQVEVVTVSGTATQTTIQIPAGTILTTTHTGNHTGG